MGEIADMMLEGILDEQTGEYIGSAVGYPRTMEKGFYNSMKKKPNRKNNIQGVIKFLKRKGFDKPFPVVQEFLEKNHPKDLELTHNKQYVVVSNSYWKEFVEFIKNKTDEKHIA